MVEYVGTLIYRYIACIPTFLRSHVLNFPRDSAYPSSHGSIGSIKSTTSRMSSLSNRNANNTRSVTDTPYLISGRYNNGK